jgi:opacity protein-like surface antigen
MTLTRFGLGLLLLFPFTNVQAQVGVAPPATHPWSIVLEGGYASGVSASMRGTNDQVQVDLEKDYNNSTYPFGDPNAWGDGFGIRGEYRFLPNNIGIYAALHSTSFITSDAFSDSGVMFINTASIGAKYSLDLSPAIDVFGRVGINGSFLGGHLAYTYGDVDLTTPNTRFGFELGLGADWNPWSILLIQAFVDYSDVNLLGKSYTAPATSPPNFLWSRALNDGANPNNPNDKPRTIDYLLSGIALGVRF